jgi:hypothetical protein
MISTSDYVIIREQSTIADVCADCRLCGQELEASMIAVRSP